jgi:predicted transposase YbfD/YdcC
MNKDDEYEVLKFLGAVPDPRIDRCRKYSLESILFLALVGMLCGADSAREIEEFGDANEDWIRKYVELAEGVPSHDTITRVFSLIDKNVFCESFTKWTQSLQKATKGGEEEKEHRVIAIDGKSLCGSIGNSLTGMAHILHAWSVENGLCIGQQAVKDKSNEITAMIPLLKMLNLKGCIVTADAIHSHKNTAKTIVEQGGDYALPIKDNQKNFKEEIEELFRDGFIRDFKGIDADQHKTLEKEHGRIENRKFWVIDAEELPSAKEWAGLKSVGLCVRERTIKEKTTREEVYYAMSLELDAKLFSEVIREHWQVENKLHWIVDVVFREDKQRYKNKTTAQNLSCVRKTAFNILKKDPRKTSMKSKRLRAASNVNYREEVLKNYL